MRGARARPRHTQTPELHPSRTNRRAARNRARITPSLTCHAPTGARRATAPASHPHSIPVVRPQNRTRNWRAARNRARATPHTCFTTKGGARATPRHGGGGGRPTRTHHHPPTTHTPRHIPRGWRGGGSMSDTAVTMNPTPAGGVARRCGDYHIARHPRDLSATRRPGAVSTTTAARRQLPHRVQGIPFIRNQGYLARPRTPRPLARPL